MPDPFAQRAEERREKIIHAVWVTVGAVALVLGWWWFSTTTLEYIFPSPKSTFNALWDLLTSGEFWAALWLTIRRSLIGLIIALLIGIVWGALCGLFETVNSFTYSWLQLLMSIPPIVMVILAMVWFGPSDTTVVTVVALVTTPLMVTSTAQAVRDINTDLIEMGEVFRFSRKRMLVHVLIPMVGPPISAAATVAMGQSIRVGVMAELLATATGIGAGIRLAQINIETPLVFAYALVMAAVTFILDYALIKPVRKRFMIHTLRNR